MNNKNVFLLKKKIGRFSNWLCYKKNFEMTILKVNGNILGLIIIVIFCNKSVKVERVVSCIYCMATSICFLLLFSLLRVKCFEFLSMCAEELFCVFFSLAKLNFFLQKW